MTDGSKLKINHEFTEDIIILAKAFYNHEIERIDLYLKGFGGIFAKRTRDGMVLGYLDRQRKIGKEDHATVFFNSKDGLIGLHRTVIDSESTVYMKYSTEYITKKDGFKIFLRDLRRDEVTPGIMKGFLFLVYFELRSFYRMGFKKMSMLSNTKAKRLGMKSPCIFIETNLFGMIQMVVFAQFIRTVSYLHNKQFADKATRAFKKQRLTGTTISKKKKVKQSKR